MAGLYTSWLLTAAHIGAREVCHSWKRLHVNSMIEVDAIESDVLSVCFGVVACHERYNLKNQKSCII